MKNRFLSIINKIKKITILTLLLALFIFINAIGYVSAISNNISDSIFRLHVIANSNSDEDQNLKYIVRDAVIDYVSSTYNVETKTDLINSIDLNIIKDIAEKTVLENGYSYPIEVEIGNFSFPTKAYGNITLPAGFYDALRIKIGNSEGKNWWCVMFPPLCFVDISTGVVPDSSKELLKENLENEEYSLISDNSDTVRFKFKIVEFFENINMKIASLSGK